MLYRRNRCETTVRVVGSCSAEPVYTPTEPTEDPGTEKRRNGRRVGGRWAKPREKGQRDTGRVRENRDKKQRDENIKGSKDGESKKRGKEIRRDGDKEGRR